MSDEQIKKITLVGQIYTPAYPIEIKELFSGRAKELITMMNIVNQKGRQVLLYGDRGVGKTSFANVIKILLENPDRQVAKVSCSSDDTLESLFHNVFSKLSMNFEVAKQQIGYLADVEKSEESVMFSNIYSEEKINANVIQNVLSIIGNPILIIDEFDRLEKDKFNHRVFSDIIKMVSDTIPYATIILVGVAEDVSSLIEEHESIERNLAQIHLYAMTKDEIKGIISKGEGPLDIIFTEDVKIKIIELSSGYPHFTHSLCYYASTATIWDNVKEVNMDHLSLAIQQTIDNAHESLRNSYRVATLATKQNIYQEVLYAAALVNTDEYGYFQANDLEAIISALVGKEMKVNNFTFHIGKFCSEERGGIFKISGTKNRHRYKFRNPLMKSFIKLKMEQAKNITQRPDELDLAGNV